MTEFETASLIIAGANATAAATATAGIWYGIRAMIRANKERAGILDRQREADEHRHDEAMRRHDEAMQAGDQRHAEAHGGARRPAPRPRSPDRRHGDHDRTHRAQARPCRVAARREADVNFRSGDALGAPNPPGPLSTPHEHAGNGTPGFLSPCAGTRSWKLRSIGYGR